ncbi:MAG TPA: hypothetical protein VF600_10535 [Abditibacteriaceae bacterium]|jgi:hypothetical protein
MSNAEGNGNQQRTRRLAMAATAMFVMSASVFGGLFFLNSRADEGSMPDALGARTVDGSSRMEVERPWEDPQKAKELRDQRIARARAIRQKLRPWAYRNKDVLQRLLSAQPDDEAALMTAWNIIPGNPAKAGLGDKEDLGGGTPPFSWAGTAKAITLSDEQQKDPQMVQNLEKMRLQNAKWIRENFHKYRDIRISDSVHAGPDSVVIWLSGRITERRIVPNRAPRITGVPWPATVEAPPVEIAPPYDFFKISSKQRRQFKDS